MPDSSDYYCCKQFPYFNNSESCWAAVEFAFFDRDVDRRWINDDPTLILNNISDQCFVNVDNMYRNQR